MEESCLFQLGKGWVCFVKEVIPELGSKVRAYQKNRGKYSR